MKTLLAAILFLPLIAFGQIRPATSGPGSAAAGGSATNAQPPSSILTNLATVGVSTTNVVWVSKAGNDTTGARGRLDLPFQTLNAAKLAAIAGDTVKVLPGTYNGATNLLKNLVNWDFFTGCTIAGTNTTNDLGWGVFDDRFVSGGCTSRISGRVDIFYSTIRTGYNLGTGSYTPSQPNYLSLFGVLVVTNPLSDITMSAGRVNLANYGQKPLYGAYVIDARKVILDWEEMVDGYYTNAYYLGDDDVEPRFGASVTGGFYWELGEMIVHCAATTVSYNAIYCQELSGNLLPQNFWFTGDYIENNNNALIYLISSNSFYRGWINVKEARNLGANAGGVISLSGGGSYYIDAQKMNCTAPAAYPAVQLVGPIGAANPPNLWLRAMKISATNAWFQNSGANAFVDVQHWEDLGSVGVTAPGIEMSGGTTRFNGGSATITNTSGRCVLHTGGTNYLSGMRLDNGFNTNSPVWVRTNNLTLNGCVLVCTNARFSVTSDVDATNGVKIYNTVATSATTNKVTVQVGTFTVDTNVQ